MVLAGSMFFLVPRGQGSINFLQRSLACAEHAAGTQPWDGQTRSFFRFLLYFIYFLFNEPSLMPAGTSKPLPLLPQPSATSTRKTAKSDTRQLLGGNVSMFLPLTTPDSSRQRFYSIIEGMMFCAMRFHFAGSTFQIKELQSHSV